MKHSAVTTTDVERDANDESNLTNTEVKDLAWRKVDVVLNRKGSDTRKKSILSNIDGYAAAGMVDIPS